MTAITHPLPRNHHVTTALIAAAISVGLVVALVLALTTTGSSSSVSHPAVARTTAASGSVGTINSGPDNPSRVSSAVGSGLVGTINRGPDNPSRVSSASCTQFANASDSPEGFRLAERLATLGNCQ